MKKTLTRLGAIVLALTLVLSIGAVAFADADMTNQDGVIGEFDTPDTPVVQDDAVIIYKEITAYNPETCTVNAPTITYTYSVTAGDAGKTITDASSHHAQINSADVNVSVTTKAGVGTPVITGTTQSNSTTGNGALHITPADQLSASENGTANRFEIEIDFSSIDYTTAGSGAGVYRYVITESCTEATKNAAGIAEGSVANTLYMDVYVNGEGDIYGYVLFTNNDNIDASPDADATAATAAGKTEGFVGGEADGTAYATDTSVADKYYTFNLELSKDVQNDAYAATTHHQFPFTVVLYNPSVTADVLPIMTVGLNATQTALTAGPIAGTWTPTIADDAVISYVGIPCGTTINIYEQNDVIGVTYSSVSTGADTDAVARSIGYGAVSDTAVVNCGATPLTVATENHVDTAKVLFTNTLLDISPTGIVVRVAPFVLIMAAGIALVLVVTRRRREVEE